VSAGERNSHPRHGCGLASIRNSCSRAATVRAENAAELAADAAGSAGVGVRFASAGPALPWLWLPFLLLALVMKAIISRG
jgi:hypothetical protein